MKKNKLLRLAAAAFFASTLLRLAATAFFTSMLRGSARSNKKQELKSLSYSMSINVWKINKLLRLAAAAFFASALRDSSRKKKNKHDHKSTRSFE